MLPNYIGILISHCKDPYEPIRISFNVTRVLLPLLRCTKRLWWSGEMLQNLGPRSSSHCAMLAQQLLDQGRHITTGQSQLPMKCLRCHPWDGKIAVDISTEVGDFFLRTHLDVKLFHSLNAWPFWICSISEFQFCWESIGKTPEYQVHRPAGSCDPGATGLLSGGQRGRPRGV